MQPSSMPVGFPTLFPWRINAVGDAGTPDTASCFFRITLATDAENTKRQGQIDVTKFYSPEKALRAGARWVKSEGLLSQSLLAKSK